MRKEKELLMLDDHFKWEWKVDLICGDDKVVIFDDGKEIELDYEITLSQEYNDDECMRVKYKGKYYYFG